MRIAAIQHDIVFEDAVATRARRRAHDRPGSRCERPGHRPHRDVRHRFLHVPERIAEDEGGPSEQFLIDQARQNDAWLIASIAQRGADGRYRNNAVVAGPDGSASRYSKIHPFSYAQEDEHYAAGTEHLTVDIDGLRTTVFICYDLRFADEFWETRSGHRPLRSARQLARAATRPLARTAAGAGDREPGLRGRSQPGWRGQGCCAPRRLGHHRPARAHAGGGERRRGRIGSRGLG